MIVMFCVTIPGYSLYSNSGKIKYMKIKKGDNDI